MLRVSEMVEPDLVKRGTGRTVNRISGKKGEKKEEEYYRKECQC